MKIGFFGGGVAGLAVLERIVDQPGWKIVFVQPRDADGLVVTEFAQRRDVEIMDFDDINAESALAYVQSKNPELLLSVNCRKIFRRPLLDIPRYGAINVHDGMLPLQRGGGGTFIGMINGEACGTTVHLIDDGIDTGDIILQQEIPLPPDATMAEFERGALEIWPDMVVTAIRQIQNECVWRRPQRDLPYSYVPAKAPWDELIDWSLDTKRICDRVRARTPGPANFFVYDDEIIEVLAVEPEPLLVNYVNTPGQVLRREKARGVLVKTGDTGIWLTKVRLKADREETIPSYPPSTMLCHNVHKEIYELKKRLAELERRLQK